LLTNTRSWSFNNNGSLTYPDNSIQVTAYTGTSWPSQVGQGGKFLTTDGNVLSWATVAGGVSSTNKLTNNGQEVALSPIGILLLPNGATQQCTVDVNCQAGVDTVVFTSSAPGIQTIKLLLQAEGMQGSGLNHTQSCEMVVTKGFNGPTVASSVYGLVYSSNTPLATFTAEWNASISRVEVTCRPTSLTNNVAVKSFATEITTAD
jgi:hypothetical protein